MVMATPYKGCEKYSHYALAHIKAQGIRCRKYAWICQTGNVDCIKIDGKYQYFDIDTHKRIAPDRVA